MTSEDDKVKETHRKRHVFLHAALDELVADFIGHTGKRPSQTGLLELMQWSAAQTKNPTEDPDGE